MTIYRVIEWICRFVYIPQPESCEQCGCRCDGRHFDLRDHYTRHMRVCADCVWIFDFHIVSTVDYSNWNFMWRKVDYNVVGRSVHVGKEKL